MFQEGKRRIPPLSSIRFNQRYTSLGDPLAYSGVTNVGRILGLKSEEVEDRLAHVYSYTLHREYKKPRHHNPFFIYFPRQQLQVDLIDISGLAEDNDGVTFLLAAIDCFTKKAWVEPLQNKKGATVLKALRTIFSNMHTLPKQIFFDHGKEFVNKAVRTYLIGENVHIVHPASTQKAAIVERFNRSIQNLLYQYCTEIGSYRYIDNLQDVVRTYNRRRHRTIHMSPNEAEMERNWNAVRDAHNERYTKLVNLRKRKIKFDLGDSVRIKKLVANFGRGYHQQFKRELFKIVKIDLRMPIPMYVIQSLDDDEIVEGKFYSNELQKVKGDIFKVEKIVKRRRKKDGSIELFIKWMDFSSRHNSWIPATNLYQSHPQPQGSSSDSSSDENE